MTINTIGKGVENVPEVTDAKNLSMCKRLDLLKMLSV
jgi:hypothetical protein